jgi:hypothetical protein
MAFPRLFSFPKQHQDCQRDFWGTYSAAFGLPTLSHFFGALASTVLPKVSTIKEDGLAGFGMAAVYGTVWKRTLDRIKDILNGVAEV